MSNLFIYIEPAEAGAPPVLCRTLASASSPLQPYTCAAVDDKRSMLM